MYQTNLHPVGSASTPRGAYRGKTEQPSPTSKLTFRTLEIYSALAELERVGDQRTLQALYGACKTPTHKIEDTCAAIAVMMSAIPFDHVDRRIKADTAEIIGRLLEKRDQTTVVRPLETLQV